MGNWIAKRLPEPETDRSTLETRYTAPTDSLETELVEIIQEILAADKVGIHDNFLRPRRHFTPVRKTLRLC